MGTFVLSSVSSHLGHLFVETESGCELGFWSTTAWVALGQLLVSLLGFLVDSKYELMGPGFPE